ncbi:hypothetical protein [Colwellia psychrerythraea]|uniref:Uncharacterized protein n=1 Tax=Colwellia psychrerythraea TaxID=28229 RepID=A0A099KLV8_COLPS|nr:hypothetical protein [Colwellia psychrerythraea]KGJ91749.1 hypothetical protein GAB14E_3231 [Colwellia psychrerythraea]
MINDLGLYGAIFNNNSTVTKNNATEIQTATEKLAENSIKSEGATDVADNIFLSSKAHKINAISTEFFSGAQLTFDDIGKLKEKLYQFGLISKGDYAALTSDTVNKSNDEINEQMSTTVLTSYIGNFIERLNVDKASETDNDTQADEVVTESETIVALTAALTTAKAILVNVEEQKQQADFKSSLQNTLLLLKETINDKSFTDLPTDDQIGLSKVHQALEIVDRLSPQRLNNDKVNQYIELAFR